MILQIINPQYHEPQIVCEQFIEMCYEFVYIVYKGKKSKFTGCNCIDTYSYIGI